MNEGKNLWNLKQWIIKFFFLVWKWCKMFQRKSNNIHKTKILVEMIIRYEVIDDANWYMMCDILSFGYSFNVLIMCKYF